MGVVGVGRVKHVLPRGVWGHIYPPEKLGALRWILVGFWQLVDYRVLTSAQNHGMLSAVTSYMTSYFLKISGGGIPG